ncbi:Rpp14/Pop5 family protein [Nanoarchaeota archaeon]
MKPILPSMKEKKRYIAFEIVSKEKQNFSSISKTIKDAVLSYIGILGSGKAGILLIKDKFNQSKQKGLIKVGHKYVDDVKAALSLINKIGSTKVIIKTLGVSGIIKKADAKYVG